MYLPGFVNCNLVALLNPLSVFYCLPIAVAAVAAAVVVFVLLTLFMAAFCFSADSICRVFLQLGSMQMYLSDTFINLFAARGARAPPSQVIYALSSFCLCI